MSQQTLFDQWDQEQQQATKKRKEEPKIASSASVGMPSGTSPKDAADWTKERGAQPGLFSDESPSQQRSPRISIASPAPNQSARPVPNSGVTHFGAGSHHKPFTPKCISPGSSDSINPANATDSPNALFANSVNDLTLQIGEVKTIAKKALHHAQGGERPPLPHHPPTDYHV